MNERVARLRVRSLEAVPRISSERAEIVTDVYKREADHLSAPVLRATTYRELCERQTITIEPDELIVGERGPSPKVTPTFPELTCHSMEDLRILNSREKTRYLVSPEVMRVYEERIIPFWHGRSMRDRIFAAVSDEWRAAYDAGLFTEFMEQRAPGHTVADSKIYRKGLNGFRQDIAESLARLDDSAEPDAEERRQELHAMDISACALIRFAERHAELAEQMATSATDACRCEELLSIADVCRHVPANPPRNFREAVQMYWFCHLAVITELNGWDSYNPGHLDQHLTPFYRADIENDTLTPEAAEEILGCLWVKFNNHPAPPKVGVTAAESGTYTDFANINIGALTREGNDGSSEVSHLMLDVIDDLHILQPSNNIQVSTKTPDDLLLHACRVIAKGYGFPSLFNSDMVVRELVRQGKSVEDAREGGTSGCVEAGAFGKEAYILTGYLNLPKLLELALHNGVDPCTGKQLGPRSGSIGGLTTYGEVFAAWQTQVRHIVGVKVAGSAVIERLYAEHAPAPFLSILVDDCIARGRDYNAGGARYNTSYIQGVGIGSLTDSLSAIRKHVFEDRTLTLADLVSALDNNFRDREALRQMLVNRTPRYGNDDNAADTIMRTCFETFFSAVEGRPNGRGGEYHIDMLPTTCHVYFGSVTGATPDGRRSGLPFSEGISPVQGADRHGPTAVLQSAAQMDHERTGGTLLNQKIAPSILATEDGIRKLAQMVRAYFAMGGHHIQFNVVSADTLRDAQRNPEAHRDLIVRVAGYSDYFCDLSATLQDEIIARTEHQAL